jgi:cycloeucalenol cycloisomerase
MPAHDVNGVPIAMFFATHFYFTLYHALAAKALRWVQTTFVADGWRAGFTAALIGAMAYTTESTCLFMCV